MLAREDVVEIVALRSRGWLVGERDRPPHRPGTARRSAPGWRRVSSSTVLRLAADGGRLGEFASGGLGETRSLRDAVEDRVVVGSARELTEKRGQRAQA